MASGAEVPIAAVTTLSNVAIPPSVGEDYYGGPIKIAGELAADAIPTQPLDPANAVLSTIDLTRKSAVRFQATLGGDFPLGDETQRRKVYALRTQGTDTRYLTLIEPYRGSPMVISAVALEANTVRIFLADGRVQTIAISNMDGDGHNIAVKIDESGGPAPRSETTTAAPP